jgi:hypothetical protein
VTFFKGYKESEFGCQSLTHVSGYVNTAIIRFRNIYDVRGAVDFSDCLSDGSLYGVSEKFGLCVALLYEVVCFGL